MASLQSPDLVCFLPHRSIPSGPRSGSSLFAWLISHQPAVLFSQNKPATSNQPAVLFSQNKPATAISHPPTEQAVGWKRRARGRRRERRHVSSLAGRGLRSLPGFPARCVVEVVHSGDVSTAAEGSDNFKRHAATLLTPLLPSAQQRIGPSTG
jgi:hypothetical protein